TVTPSMPESASTIASACSVSRAAHVPPPRSRYRPCGVRSSAVTAPPASSTAWVSSLTARPREGTSSRTVIEYDTLGATVTVRPPSSVAALRDQSCHHCGPGPHHCGPDRTTAGLAQSCGGPGPPAAGVAGGPGRPGRPPPDGWGAPCPP